MSWVPANGKNQKVRMSLRITNHDPGFRITRASHVVLTVRDLAASRQFYEKVIGLILTAEEGGALYFRGVEEACHHSLVLRKSAGTRDVCLYARSRRAPR